MPTICSIYLICGLNSNHTYVCYILGTHHELTVVPGAESQEGYFVNLQWFDDNDQSLSPITTPHITINLPDAINVVMSSNCANNHIVHADDAAREIYGISHQCQLSVVLEFENSILFLGDMISLQIEKLCIFYVCLSHLFLVSLKIFRCRVNCTCVLI